eukprot:gene6352-gene2699
MPTRDTGAGAAWARSCTSNTMCTKLVRRMCTPWSRHSSLESSSTEFIDSIHSVSTGPSNTIQWWSPDSSVITSFTFSGRMPGVHSWVSGFIAPNSSPYVIDFGFISWVCTVCTIELAEPSFRRDVSADPSTLRQVVLPLRVGPTSMTPCLTIIVSYNCMILVRNDSGCLRDWDATSPLMASSSSP